MGKTWVLKTETKGTGATMVPLESTAQRSAPTEPVFVPREHTPRDEPAPDSPAPRRFRVVDVMTRQELVADGSAREAVDALRAVHSLVDVDVYVWQPIHNCWRMLTSPERHAIWDLAGH